MLQEPPAQAASVAGPAVISVIALVFTESIGANQGIGYLVSQADSLQQIPTLVVCVVIYALLRLSGPIVKRLSAGTLSAFDRILGFLILAIAIELIITGFQGVYPKFGV